MGRDHNAARNIDALGLSVLKSLLRSGEEREVPSGAEPNWAGGRRPFRELAIYADEAEARSRYPRHAIMPRHP